MHCPDDRRPAALNRRRVTGAIDETVIDAPRERVNVKRGAARLGKRKTLRIEKARSPIAVRLLQRDDLRRHLAEEILVARPLRIIGGHLLQHAHESSQHPRVSAAPENLFPEETAVAVVEVFLL